MQTENTHLKAPEWLILARGCFFILVLGISAFWERDIRWPHFFRAWIYVAAIVSSLWGNRSGYVIGLSGASLRGYANVFDHGLLFQWVPAVVAMDAHGAFGPAGFADCRARLVFKSVCMLGCPWAYSGLPRKSVGDAGCVASRWP